MAHHPRRRVYHWISLMEGRRLGGAGGVLGLARSGEANIWSFCRYRGINLCLRRCIAALRQSDAPRQMLLRSCRRESASLNSLPEWRTCTFRLNFPAKLNRSLKLLNCAKNRCSVNLKNYIASEIITLETADCDASSSNLLAITMW